MGAWGHRTFENDDASDWLYELYESEDLSVAEAALDSVMSGGYLEAPDCWSALAAAEVVAALHDKSASSLPKELTTWIEGKPKPKSALLAKARQAVAAILASSELQELWAESEDAEAWQSDVRRLQSRLT